MHYYLKKYICLKFFFRFLFNLDLILIFRHLAIQLKLKTNPNIAASIYCTDVSIDPTKTYASNSQCYNN